MHGKEIAQYLQNYKCHEVDQDHSEKLLESSTGVSLPDLLHGFWRNIFLFSTSAFSTRPKSQDKNLNILRTKRDFKMK